MKIKINSLYATIEEITESELIRLVLTLTFCKDDVKLSPKERLVQIPIIEYGDLPKEDSDDLQIKTVLFRNNKGKYYFYSNLIPFLKNEFNIESDIEYVNCTNIIGSVSPNILENITLRDYQVKTLNKLMAYHSGVFIGATGFGKTAVIIALCKEYLDTGKSNKILIVTPNLAITDNMINRFESHNLSYLVSGAGGKYVPSDTPVIVGNINTVYKSLTKGSGKVYELIKDVDTLIYDECHHVSAYTVFRVGTLLQNVKYRYGFSGTPFKSEKVFEDHGDTLLRSLLGPTIASVSTKYLIDRGYLATPVVLFKKVGVKGRYYPGKYVKIYERFIVNNIKRNEYIYLYTKFFLKHGLKTLILVQRINHIDLLLRSMKGMKILGICGGNTGKLVDENGCLSEFSCNYDTAWDLLENGTYDVVIATTIADEGVDIPSVGAVIMGGGAKSIIKINQRAGRGLRAKKVNENKIFILDFDDLGHPYMKSHSNKRMQIMENMGAKIIDEPSYIQTIYDVTH